MSDFLYIDQKTRTNVEKTSQANISKDLFENYRIDRSLRFNSADSTYLSRTPASTTNRKTWTYSTWIKRTKLSSASTIFFGWDGSATSTVFQFTSTDNLELYNFAGAYYAPRLITNQVLRDVSAWYHIVLVWDADNATSADRQRIYINGVRVTSFSTESYSNDIAYGINVASYPHLIGGGAGNIFDAYMAETHFIDGQALTPSSFGFFDNQRDFTWKPKKYSGSYGNNGFYLNFSNNSSASLLGKDFSGNGNNWTPNNFSVTAGAGNDSLVDSPTNYGSDTGVGGEVRGNYPVFNSISKNSSVTISDGGLRAAFTNNRFQSVTIPIPTTGKWYAEFTALNGSSTYSIGIGDIAQNANSSYSLLSSSPAISYINNGNKNVNGTVNAGGATYTTNDIIGVAVDSGSSSVSFYKNNSLQFTVSGSSFSTYAGRWVFGGDASAFSEVLVFNGGQRPFAYTAPSGFKALCTTNLPIPSIKKPSSYFDAVTYTGNGSTQTISGLGFSPDFLWSKSRSVGRSNRLIDSVRGIDNVLVSDTTAAEYAGSAISSFNSNGFSLKNADNYNVNSETYIAWAWDAGNSTVTNTSGSITSTVRANPQNGVSIVGYTGNGTAGATVGHGLGVSPSMIIAKKRSTATSSQWTVGFSALGWNKYILLNTTGAAATDSNVWNSAPTSSVFYLGNDIWNNHSGQTTIAYCFAEVEGFSKFGSYTGNGSADGSFVYCGFRPRWVLFKNTTLGSHWVVYDTARETINPLSAELAPNNSNAENGTMSAEAFDILSNGFKLRSVVSGEMNVLNSTYIFAAFAETPFKNARAK